MKLKNEFTRECACLSNYYEWLKHNRPHTTSHSRTPNQTFGELDLVFYVVSFLFIFPSLYIIWTHLRKLNLLYSYKLNSHANLWISLKLHIWKLMLIGSGDCTVQCKKESRLTSTPRNTTKWRFFLLFILRKWTFLVPEIRKWRLKQKRINAHRTPLLFVS